MRSGVTASEPVIAALMLIVLAGAGPVAADALTRPSLHGPALVVQRSRVAGLIHHAGPDVWAAIEPDSLVDLVREAANPHDERAVRIDWRGTVLGYLPRRDNEAIAWALDRGESLTAHIRPKPGRHRRRVAFEIEITLP